jgi:hypothetical protein
MMNWFIWIILYAIGVFAAIYILILAESVAKKIRDIKLSKAYDAELQDILARLNLQHFACTLGYLLGYALMCLCAYKLLGYAWQNKVPDIEQHNLHALICFLVHFVIFAWLYLYYFVRPIYPTLFARRVCT